MFDRLKTAMAGKTAVLTVVAALAGGHASATPVDLGFILDSSGSIGLSGWTTIKSGLASAIQNLVPQDGSYRVTVVDFSTGSGTIVAPTVITAASIGAVVTAINGAGFLNGQTNMAAGFTQLMTALGISSTNQADTLYVNLATDGVPNIGSPDPATATVNARNALIAAGADNISIEGIGSGVNASFLQTSICYPLACTIDPTFNFPSQGFYIPISSTADFGDAVSKKIRVITNQIPEPEMLLIFAVGLIGLGIMRRRAA